MNLFIKDLPKTCLCPSCNSQATQQEIHYNSDDSLCVVQGADCFDVTVIHYKCLNNHSFYISVDDEVDDNMDEDNDNDDDDDNKQHIPVVVQSFGMSDLSTLICKAKK